MTTCSKPLLCGIPFPGVDEDIATTMAAEMGIRTEQFADGPHLASWTAMCPGNHESAGKRKSGKTRKGNRWLRGALTQAEWAASHTKGTYLSGLFRRISARRGAKRAIVAVGHSILISAYYVLARNEPYTDLGFDHYQRLEHHDHQVRRLTRQLEALGHRVTLEPLAA